MKKIKVAAVYFFLSLFFIQLTGCRKLVDRIFYGELEVRDCKIVQFKQFLEFGNDLVRTAPVYYNDRGDPDSVMFDIETGSAGAVYFIFKYDEYSRLRCFSYLSYIISIPAPYWIIGINFFTLKLTE